MDKKVILGSLLTSVALLGMGHSGEAAAKKIGSLQSESKKVTVTYSKARLYTNSKLEKSSVIKQGTVYQVDGYRIIDGKHFYRVYQQDSTGATKYRGYLIDRDTKELKASKVSGNFKGKKDMNVWKNLYFSQKQEKLTKEKAYFAKYKYTLGNGRSYYSLYQKDSQGKDKWAGYMNVVDTAPLKAVSYEKYMTLTRDSQAWKNLYFTQKGTNYLGKYSNNFKVKRYYDLNNYRYYSAYRTDASGKENWCGYINGNALKELKKVAVPTNEQSMQTTKETDAKNHYMIKRSTLKKGTRVTAKYSYTYGNGTKVYEVYNGDKWLGHVNANDLAPAASLEQPYFSKKNIADVKGKIVVNTTHPKANIYQDPDTGKLSGKTTQDYNNKAIKYVEETFNNRGNFVKAYLLNSNGSTGSFVGWVPRTSVVNETTKAKLADQSKNYSIWTTPASGKRASMDSFEKGFLEADQEAIDKNGREYYHLVANGGNIGWVNKGFVKANYIKVPEKISLVHSFKEDAKWNPRHAVTAVTDSEGTVVDPLSSQLKVSQESLSTTSAGTKTISYSIGSAKKDVSVTVRTNPNEGVTKVLAQPEKGNTNWAPRQTFAEGNRDLILKKSENSKIVLSPNYESTNGYETKANTYYGGTPKYTFKTKLFTPVYLSSRTVVNNTNTSLAKTSMPQGLTTIGNKAYATYMQDSNKELGRIVSYDMTKMGSLGDLRQLNKLALNDFAKFKSISENIVVSPIFYIGHGQGLSTDGNTLTFIPSEYRSATQYNGFNQMMTLNKDTLEPTRMETFRMVANWSEGNYSGRNAFNIATKDANTYYHLQRSDSPDNPEKSNAKMEIYEIKRQSDGSFTTKRVMVTRFILGYTKKDADDKEVSASPQGLTYNKAQNAIYFAANSAFMGMQLPSSQYPNGRLIATVKLNQNRETEGISFSQDGKTMYMGVNGGAEILSASVPTTISTLK